MQNAQIEQSQNSSNKKLWIVLGSVIGGLVIIMSGCAACGAIIGISSLSNGGSTSSNSRSSGGWGASGGLANSSFKGTLNCDDGDNLPVVFKFAASGNPIYGYNTSSGSREVELEGQGQRLEYAAEGGGATYINLDEFSVSGDRMSYTMTVSHQRAGGGTMIQQRSRVTTDAVLSGSTLDVQTTFQTSSAASQPGYVIPDESGSICRGQLNKQ